MEPLSGDDPAEIGGYRFGDYWKFGAPILLWYLAVTIGLVPLVWRF